MSNLSYEPLKTYSPYPNKKRRFIIILFLIIIAVTIFAVFYLKSNDKSKAPKPVKKTQQQTVQKQVTNKKNIKKESSKISEEKLDIDIKFDELKTKQVAKAKKTIKEKTIIPKAAESKKAEKTKLESKKEEVKPKEEIKKITMPSLDEDIMNLNIAEANKNKAKLDKFIKVQEKILKEAEELYKNKDYFGVHEKLAKIVENNNFYTTAKKQLNSGNLNTVKNSKDSKIENNEKKNSAEFNELTLNSEKNKNKDGKLPFDLWLKMVRIYSDANTKTFFSNRSYSPFDKTIYKVQRGDALQKIAKKFKTTITAIQKRNSMNKYNYNIRVGENLSIYDGDWHIIVNKSKFLLMLFDKDNLFAAYSIALGKNNKTPIGNFKIISKVIEPDWYSNNEKIPYGDERNVLGTRWMEIKSTDDKNRKLKGYGVHGTWERNSINKMRSNGCVRMLNENVEELFDIIPINTPIKIIE